jgi:hypothetical protein
MAIETGTGCRAPAVPWAMKVGFLYNGEVGFASAAAITAWFV